MWEIINKISKANISPNQLFLMYGMYEKIQVPMNSTVERTKEDVSDLVKENFIELNENKRYTITTKGLNLIEELDNYFTKAKKKTNAQLMGKEFSEKIQEYRNVFPSGKLPSGVPARQNIKALNESFRWFFENYNYTWDQVLNATRMYVNEYRSTNYLYMVTSQYFIAKQDKHKVKNSKLADYCDMVIEGVNLEVHSFKEKVV
jgi:predicted transcriptional regulator